MNGKAHVWIVEDALRFVLAQGNQREKDAFQAWELSYGGGILTPSKSSQSRVVDIIGQESRYTDKYYDMTLYVDDFLTRQLFKVYVPDDIPPMQTISGNSYEGIAVVDGHVITALNHFLAVPWASIEWRRTSGYHYYWSPQTGNDYTAMASENVDKADIEVDNDYSPVVSRCKFGWLLGDGNWNNNWEVDIRETHFIPVSVLAEYYYGRLLNNFFNYLDVNGQLHDSIVGMHYLGPICHAVADACVPHHAITTMDLKHSEWENMVESWAYLYQLEDFNLVRSLLNSKLTRTVYSTGALSGMFEIDRLVHKCGCESYTNLLIQNGLTHPSGIPQIKSPSFWNTYIADFAKVKNHARFNYNLAIAATVRVITESCYDLIAKGGGTSSPLAITGFPGYTFVGGIPKRLGPPLKPKEVVAFSVSDLLGTKSDIMNSVNAKFQNVRMTLHERFEKRTPKQDVISSLDDLEDSFIQYYRKARSFHGDRSLETFEFPKQTEGLREKCSLPKVDKNLELSSHFGLSTFRPPTDDELNDSKKFGLYLKKSEENTINAKLLSLTRCIALQKFIREQITNRRDMAKLDEEIVKLEKIRNFIIDKNRIPTKKARISQPPNPIPINQLNNI